MIDFKGKLARVLAGLKVIKTKRAAVGSYFTIISQSFPEFYE